MTYEAQIRARLEQRTEQDGDEVLRARLREKQRVDLRGDEDTGRVVARSKTKLDFRAELEEDGDLELRFKASFRTSLRTYEAGEDRSGALASVERLSQSIKLRVSIDASQVGNASDLGAALGSLADRFGSALGGESAAFATGEAPSPEALIDGIRSAFASLLSNLRALFAGSGASPELPAGAAVGASETGETDTAEAADAAPVASAGEAAAPVAIPAPPESAALAEPVAASPVPATVPHASAASRFLRLRGDLQELFGNGFRNLLQELVERRAAEREQAALPQENDAPAASGAGAEPALSGLQARFTYRERYDLRLIDTRA